MSKNLNVNFNSKKLEMANIINSTGGKTMSKKFEKIVLSYANGDIDYKAAVNKIKKEFFNERPIHR